VPWVTVFADPSCERSVGDEFDSGEFDSGELDSVLSPAHGVP
jgi:hypothetical protein